MVVSIDPQTSIKRLVVVGNDTVYTER
ncbi:hypothetical protein LCGC14_0623940, partial [marine sediment metagenome]